MGFIKKYKMFTEEVTMDAPVLKENPVVDIESSDMDVIDRFSRIYSSLPTEKKAEINKYFK